MAKKKRLFDEDGNEVIKKPIYKRWWFILIAGIFIISAIVGGDDDSLSEATEDDTEEVIEVKEKESEEEIEEVEEVVEETIEEVEEEEDNTLTAEEEAAFEREFAILMVESIAIESFSDMADAHYSESEDAIVITPTSQDFVNALFFIETGLMNKDEWYSLRDNFVYYSETISEAVDKDISVMIANPENPEKYILYARDGEVLYDVFEE